MHVVRRVIPYLLQYRGKMVGVLLLSFAIAFLYFGTIGSMKPVGDLLFTPEHADEMLSGRFFETEYGQRVDRFVRDKVLPNRLQALAWVSVGVIIVSSLRNLCRYFQGYVTHVIEKSVTRDILNDLFLKVEHLPLRYFHEEEGVAKTISRFVNDSYLLAAGIRNMFSKALMEPLNIVVALILALMINWRLTLLSVIVLPAFGGLITYFGRRVKKRVRKNLRKKAELQHALDESLTGLRIVKAFRAEEHEAERFRQRNEEFTQNDLRLSKLDAMTSPAVETVSTFALAGMIYLTGWMIIVEKSMSGGDFFVFFGALLAMFDPIRRLAKLNNKLQMSVAAGTRIFELMDTDPEIHEKPDAVTAPPLAKEIRFEKVDFHYREGEPILQGLDLTVPCKQKIGIVGRTGHGKSTLMNLVLRFYDVTGGRLTFDGVDIREATLDSVRGQIGLVSQEVILFNDTIAANIAYGRRAATREEIVEAAKKAHAHEFIVTLPGGYDTILGDKGTTLSGGQRQRLSIARAILKDPAILVLDEATSSLDSESESLIQDALEVFVEDRTCFIISHRMSTLGFCDSIIVMYRGAIEAIGTHEELLESSATYRDLFGRQMTGGTGVIRAPEAAPADSLAPAESPGPVS